MRSVMPSAVRRLLPGVTVAALALAGALTVATSGAAAAPHPPTPALPTGVAAPSAVVQAQQQADAANAKLATLDKRIAAQTKHVQALSTAANRARDRYSAQLVARQEAAQRAQAAATARQQAQLDYEQAHDRFVEMIRGTVYQDGNPVADTAYAVLTANGPNEVLDALELGRMAEENQSSVVDDMNGALARRTTAEHAQQAALERETQLASQLAQDASAADTALARARRGLTALRAEIARTKQSQAAAIAALSQFLGGWSMADPAQAAALNERYRQIAAEAAALPLPKNPGHWTPALGEYAANRALAWIGTPYAWAGGNAAGPTRGVCAGGDAAQDCHVVGFDCSGLSLYGWAPFQGLPHLASTQYLVAGRTHPALGQLLPGDLVFWSDNGQAGGIHHVAVYVGNGNVVQAPQSGDIVRVTPLGSVDSGYFGATRPLS